MLGGCAGAGVGTRGLNTQARVAYGEGATMVQDSSSGATDASARLRSGGMQELEGHAWGHAGYGEVRGEAVISAKRAGFMMQVAHGEAAFSDTLTILGGEGEGRVMYSFALKGSGSGAGLGSAHLFVHHGDDADEELVEQATASGEFKTVAHRFRYGVPFDMRVVLLCDAQLQRGQSGEAACGFTATLRSLEVFDSAMKAQGGIEVKAASGTAYRVSQ